MLSEREARELDVRVRDTLFPWDARLCRACGGPLRSEWRFGCVEGNCSERPAPTLQADSPAPFSTDLIAAMLVVDEVMKDAFAYVLYANHADGFACTFESSDGKEYRATAYSLPHAICLAALAVSEARSLQSSRGSQK